MPLHKALNPAPTPNRTDLWPRDALLAHPRSRPLAVCTAGRVQTPGEHALPRWTVIAQPTAVHTIRTPDELWHQLDRIRAQTPCNKVLESDSHPDRPPFRSGLLLALSYELGSTLEPAARCTPRANGPLGYVFECPGTRTHDALTGQWTNHGDPAAQPTTPDTNCFNKKTYDISSLTSQAGETAYRRSVERGLTYIGAGDVYQVNLAHRLSAAFEGSPRALMADLLGTAAPLHGFYAEPPDHPDAPLAICSASPELFLSYDPVTRAVRTSPMKGTRPIQGDPDELRGSEKDRAELNMITDLMRNDLGRVCAFGSVNVEHARTIEAHGKSVWQATSTVSGTLREGLGIPDLIRATFPPGSVTGAPKVRAMQIIDELEQHPRGFYCGAMGWLDDSGTMSLNVAIRTAVIERGQECDRLVYHAGAGIVADSDPGAEWAETLAKAAIISDRNQR